MIRKIQHLRGSESDYQEHDLVVPDGELALLKRDDGTTAVKIGDGVRPFSALPYLGRTVREEQADSAVTLANETEHRLPLSSRVEIVLPEAICNEFTSVVTFTSPNEGTTVIYPAGKILFIGDHTDGGIFVPEPRYHYVLCLRYNGEVLLGEVSAVSVDLITYLPREIKEISAYGAIGIPLRSADDLLDVTIGGKTSPFDSTSDYTGVGEMDYTTYRTILNLLVTNKTVTDFDTFARRFIETYPIDQITSSYKNGKLSYFTKSKMVTGFITSENAAFASGVSYRIRLQVTKDGGSWLQVGQIFDTGFAVYYTDGSSSSIRKTYTGRTDENGCPLETVEYYTDKNKTVSFIAVRYTPEGATNILTADNFLFVADDGTDDVPAPKSQIVKWKIDEYLCHVGDVRDTLSLSSGTVTRRVRAQRGDAMPCEVYDRTGEYTIFRYTLIRPAKPHSPITMPGFRNLTYEELKSNEMSCCITEDTNSLFFTLGQWDSSIEDYWYFLDEVRIPAPVYLLKNEEIKTISKPDMEIYDGYTAISVPINAQAHLCATYLE